MRRFSSVLFALTYYDVPAPRNITTPNRISRFGANRNLRRPRRRFLLFRKEFSCGAHLIVSSFIIPLSRLPGERTIVPLCIGQSSCTGQPPQAFGHAGQTETPRRPRRG